MGWGTLTRSFYPRLNAWLIALGITAFYLCDVSVGLAADLANIKDERASAFLDNLVGFFYTPALTCLALSGFVWSGPGTALPVALASGEERKAQPSSNPVA
jgi:hypothetical protein